MSAFAATAQGQVSRHRLVVAYHAILSADTVRRAMCDSVRYKPPIHNSFSTVFAKPKDYIMEGRTAKVCSLSKAGLIPSRCRELILSDHVAKGFLSVHSKYQGVNRRNCEAGLSLLSGVDLFSPLQPVIRKT